MEFTESDSFGADVSAAEDIFRVSANLEDFKSVRGQFKAAGGLTQRANAPLGLHRTTVAGQRQICTDNDEAPARGGGFVWGRERAAP